MAAMLLLHACSSDDVYTVYSKYRASFSYERVMTAEPLRSALTSPGEFCIITVGISTLNFQSLSLSYSDPITASTMFYKSYRCMSMDGFIVGKANQLEMNEDELKIVCFDIACSNCYHEDNVHSRLSLQENGVAYCKRCKRHYRMNDTGLANEGGRPLERYHISYDGSNRMVISN